MYAVIRTGGKQYRVVPGDVVRVEKLPGEVGQEIEFGDVLMVGGEDETIVGKPNVKGVKVTGKIVQQDRGRKIIVFKQKKRKHYRKKQGHRQYFTGVAIQSIEKGAKASPGKGVKTSSEEE